MIESGVISGYYFVFDNGAFFLLRFFRSITRDQPLLYPSSSDYAMHASVLANIAKLNVLRYYFKIADPTGFK